MGLTQGDNILKLDGVTLETFTLGRVLATLSGAPKSRLIVGTTNRNRASSVPVLRDCVVDEDDYLLPPPPNPGAQLPPRGMCGVQARGVPQARGASHSPQAHRYSQHARRTFGGQAAEQRLAEQEWGGYGGHLSEPLPREKNRTPSPFGWQGFC
jgi:hypothetical protein